MAADFGGLPQKYFNMVHILELTNWHIFDSLYFMAIKLIKQELLTFIYSKNYYSFQLRELTNLLCCSSIFVGFSLIFNWKHTKCYHGDILKCSFSLLSPWTKPKIIFLCLKFAFLPREKNQCLNNFPNLNLILEH